MGLCVSWCLCYTRVGSSLGAGAVAPLPVVSSEDGHIQCRMGLSSRRNYDACLPWEAAPHPPPFQQLQLPAEHTYVSTGNRL